MLGESLELPEGALKSVDALVTSSDGPRFLLEAVCTVLQAKDRQHFDTASPEAGGTARRRSHADSDKMPDPCG
jgi:hypothetical protein